MNRIRNVTCRYHFGPCDCKETAAIERLASSSEAECLCGQNNDGLPRMDIVCPIHDHTAPIEAQEAKDAAHHERLQEGARIGWRTRKASHPEATQGDELGCRCWDDGALLYSYLCPIHGEADPELVAILDPHPARWLSNSGATNKTIGDIYTAITAYLTTTATRMAVEARIDEIELTQAKTQGGGKHWRVLPIVYLPERLAELQAQLKNGDKS